MERKKFKLDLTIAIEARDKHEPIQILCDEKTLEGIRRAILESEERIEEVFFNDDENDNSTLIN